MERVGIGNSKDQESKKINTALCLRSCAPGTWQVLASAHSSKGAPEFLFGEELNVPS